MDDKLKLGWQTRQVNPYISQAHAGLEVVWADV